MLQSLYGQCSYCFLHSCQPFTSASCTYGLLAKNLCPAIDSHPAIAPTNPSATFNALPERFPPLPASESHPISSGACPAKPARSWAGMRLRAIRRASFPASSFSLLTCVYLARFPFASTRVFLGSFVYGLLMPITGGFASVFQFARENAAGEHTLCGKRRHLDVLGEARAAPKGRAEPHRLFSWACVCFRMCWYWRSLGHVDCFSLAMAFGQNIHPCIHAASRS